LVSNLVRVYILEKLTSLQNPFIKSLALLRDKGKVRQQNGTFLIEGKKEISLAFEGGYEIEKILFVPEFISANELKNCSEETKFIEVSKEIFRKLAYRENTGGVIGIAKSRKLNLSNLRLSENPLILIAEAPEKPGNIGALLRTADAAKLDAVIIANPKGDLYNPNIIRSSVGCLFTNQIATGTTAEIISFLKENDITIYCATLQKAISYHTVDYTMPAALVVGTESTGLSQEWRDSAAENIIIPMKGKIDSMNISVSASILIFEAKRQRGF